VVKPAFPGMRLVAGRGQYHHAVLTLIAEY